MILKLISTSLDKDTYIVLQSIYISPFFYRCAEAGLTGTFSHNLRREAESHIDDEVFSGLQSDGLELTTMDWCSLTFDL